MPPVDDYPLEYDSGRLPRASLRPAYHHHLSEGSLMGPTLVCWPPARVTAGPNQRPLVDSLGMKRRVPSLTSPSEPEAGGHSTIQTIGAQRRRVVCAHPAPGLTICSLEDASRKQSRRNAVPGSWIDCSTQSVAQHHRLLRTAVPANQPTESWLRPFPISGPVPAHRLSASRPNHPRDAMGRKMAFQSDRTLQPFH